ncbi:3D domain-containing protein [Paenibacillus sp. XY044]|uniref:3D domain-containing protein n=1 Tax=Paenibacillus sp. XY044 TaxID=2026089 RepID=UPI000B984CD6|nr:3D domain-containing protein [Paenibacillus sp. XY044]OZB98083.1 hypothetical protein CJP46_02640 [Paenibacillus sp. XY044]
MGSFILFLLLTLSANKSELEGVMKAQEAANTIHKQSVQVEMLDKSEKAIVKQEQKERATTSKTKVSNSSKVATEWKTYTVTAYDNGYESTQKRPGDKDYGITKSGEKTVEGRTVSADPRVLPLGTVIYIENVGERVVTDTGWAIKGRRLDLYFESHKRALQFGKQKLKVKIIKMGVKK